MTYNFYDVRNLKPLPADVNAYVEKLVAEKFPADCKDILADLEFCRKEKKHGTYTFDNVFRAEFHDGVIKMIWLEYRFGKKRILDASEFNKSTNFTKLKKEVNNG